MRMMEMPSDQVINVIAMRDCLVATTWTVDVFSVVLATGMFWGTGGWILLADRNHVFCYLAAHFLMA